MNTQRRDQQLNIVLIVLDSVRKDHLSCYGYSRQTTPHIDQLAAEGVRFENAYSTSCWTVPAHASLFTGLYPSQHRVDLANNTLASQHQTLASYLKTQGYSTACISCNGFVAGGVAGINRGFDLTVDPEGDYREGKSLVDRALRYFQKRWRALNRYDRGADRATQFALDWMDQQAGPFFLFMNFMDCHLPYRLKRPERYHFIPPIERKRVDRIPLDPFAAMAGQLDLTPREIAGIRALYDGSLYYLDQQIGRLVAYLKELGIYDQTLILITSDHGESFGEHGLFDHQYGLYEHLLRVPLIVRFPMAALAGTVIQHPIQHVDLYSGLKNVVSGLASGQGSVEYDRLTNPGREIVLAEYLAPNVNAIRRRFPTVDIKRFESKLRAIQAQGYKLICRQDGTRELYDLTRDPGEAVDLSESQPEKAAELEAQLHAALGPWPGGEQQAWSVGLDDELKERLKALGYL